MAEEAKYQNGGMDDKKKKQMTLRNLASQLRGENPKSTVKDEPKKPEKVEKPMETKGQEGMTFAKLKEMSPKKDDSTEVTSTLTKALIPAITTGVGYLFGGLEGGSAGATVGGKAVEDISKAETDAKAAGKEQAFELAKLELEFGGKREKEIEKRTADLRKEFQGRPGSKAAMDIIDAYDRIAVIAKRQPSAAGDLALIFNYMKMLDPRSVVRESEFKSAEQAKSWLSSVDAGEKGANIVIPSFIRTMIQKADPAKKGAFLIDTQRRDFTDTAYSLANQKMERFRKMISDYEEEAFRADVDPERVFMGPTKIEPPQYYRIVTGKL